MRIRLQQPRLASQYSIYLHLQLSEPEHFLWPWWPLFKTTQMPNIEKNCVMFKCVCRLRINRAGTGTVLVRSGSSKKFPPDPATLVILYCSYRRACWPSSSPPSCPGGGGRGSRGGLSRGSSSSPPWPCGGSRSGSGRRRSPALLLKKTNKWGIIRGVQ